jgi:anhydro-N-acetylmuramic acid kinase
MDAREFCRLDALAGQEFAAAAKRATDAVAASETAAGAAAEAPPGVPIDLVVSHGQTVFHWVEGGHARGTTQLGDPAWIAEAVGAPVLAHLRSADIAAGGEGAPLMPLFDAAWLGQDARRRGVTAATVNIGGIANVQLVKPDGTITAFDSGPGNALIDAVISRATDGAETYDHDGRIAASGRTIDPFLAALLEHPYFAAPAPKSTGRETFTLAFVDGAVERSGCPDVPLADIVATLTALTATTVVAAVVRSGDPAEVIVSGGGAHNAAMMAALREGLGSHGIELVPSAERGIDPDAKEAYLFALIGFLSWHGVPSRLPGTPPGRERILGHLLFGAHRPPLPEPLRGISGLVMHSDVTTRSGR